MTRTLRGMLVWSIVIGSAAPFAHAGAKPARRAKLVKRESPEPQAKVARRASETPERGPASTKAEEKAAARSDDDRTVYEPEPYHGRASADP